MLRGPQCRCPVRAFTNLAMNLLCLGAAPAALGRQRSSERGLPTWVSSPSRHHHVSPPLTCHRCATRQVEDCVLRDYEGNYEEFLEKNEDEAEKMAVKEERVKEIEKVPILAADSP